MPANPFTVEALPLQTPAPLNRRGGPSMPSLAHERLISLQTPHLPAAVHQSLGLGARITGDALTVNEQAHEQAIRNQLGVWQAPACRLWVAGGHPEGDAGRLRDASRGRSS